MLDKSSNNVGYEEVGGGRDEDLTAVGGGGSAATADVSGASAYVPKNWPHVRLYTESSGWMSPAYPQDTPPSFDRQRIGNATTIDGVVIPGRVEELDCWFGKERCG